MKLSLETRIKLVSIAVLIVLVVSLFFSMNATPSSVFFPLKRLQEKIFLKFKTTPSSRVEYIAGLLDIRLQEINTMVKAKDYSEILSASLRYSATAGDLTNIVLSNNMVVEGKNLKNKLIEHKKELQQILENYPVDLNTERKYIEDDINYVSIYIEQLSTNLSASK